MYNGGSIRVVISIFGGIQTVISTMVVKVMQGLIFDDCLKRWNPVQKSFKTYVLSVLLNRPNRVESGRTGRTDPIEPVRPVRTGSKYMNRTGSNRSNRSDRVELLEPVLRSKTFF